jgi:hypothetical protein
MCKFLSFYVKLEETRRFGGEGGIKRKTVHYLHFKSNTKFIPNLFSYELHSSKIYTKPFRMH